MSIDNNRFSCYDGVMSNKVYAVCAVIKKKGEPLFLGVSRKNNHDDFGLPGGKIENEETPEQAIEREVFEETGLSIKTYSSVFETFYEKGIVKTFLVSDYEGELTTKEAGKVAWVDKQKLFNGSFGEYNRNLFSKLNF